MHRIKGEMDPAVDTRAKLDAIGRSCRGRVLDVCTGLGYTAIAAAERGAVTSVDTIELDPLMAQIQRKNPWSAALNLSRQNSHLHAYEWWFHVSDTVSALAIEMITSVTCIVSEYIRK